MDKTRKWNQRCCQCGCRTCGDVFGGFERLGRLECGCDALWCLLTRLSFLFGTILLFCQRLLHSTNVTLAQLMNILYHSCLRSRSMNFAVRGNELTRLCQNSFGMPQHIRKRSRSHITYTHIPQSFTSLKQPQSQPSCCTAHLLGLLCALSRVVCPFDAREKPIRHLVPCALHQPSVASPYLNHDLNASTSGELSTAAGSDAMI